MSRLKERLDFLRGRLKEQWNVLLDLFPRRSDENSPSTTPREDQPYTLPRIEWFKTERSAQAAWDLIVDFGTAATVVLAVRGMPGYQQWKYLLGRDEGEPNGLFSSDVLVDSEGLKVLEVGTKSRAAYQEYVKDDPSQTRYRLYSSLKRYIEERSRARDEVSLSKLTQVMRDYLVKALEGNSKNIQDIRLNPNSILYASVPNGFDRRAITVVRDGVKAAIENFWQKRQGIDLKGKLEVRIIREAVAVAQLRNPALSRDLGAVSTLQGFPEGATPRWITVVDPRATRGDAKGSGVSAADSRGVNELPQLSVNCRVVVLDVGAGTTDLTLIDLREGVLASGESPSGASGAPLGTIPTSDLLLNAGVPLGGDDADRALLGALSRKPGEWSSVDNDPNYVSSKYTLLPRVRRWKHVIAEKGGVEAVHGLTDQAKQIFEEFGIESNLEDDSGEVERSYTKKLECLVLWSVKRLLALIPDEFREEGARIDEILLTGRASQLPEVRAAAWEMARDLRIGVVRTLDSAIQLKLAVALGCGLMRNSDSKLEELPSKRLGRLLRISRGLNQSFEVPPHLPASIQHPLALRFRLPRGLHFVYEFRVSCKEELSPDEIDGLLGIGLVRQLFQYEAYEYDSGGEDVIMVWESTSGEYFFAPRHKGYTALAAGEDSAKANDPISRLPVNFPSQKLENQA